MAELTVYNLEGDKVGKVSLELEAKVHPRVIHQTVLAHRAGARQGTHKTKGRTEVRGGGRKPWRQKGTGRARQGSRRAPHWRGGGVVHGPQPRDYGQNLPRAIARQAFRKAFSDRLEDERVFVLDPSNGGEPKTNNIIQALLRLELTDRKVLLVATREEAPFLRAAKNLPQVRPQQPEQTGIVDILKSDAVVCTRAAFEALARRLSA